MSSEDNGPLATLAASINEEHRLVVTTVRSGLEHARRAGDLLAEAKEQVPHGEWLPWLAANCAVSERQAQNYMRIASRWDVLKNETRCGFGELSLRAALAILAEPAERGPELVPSDALGTLDGGWHHDDHDTDLKLAASVRQFGQLQPVLVRKGAAGELSIINGRGIVRALRAAERTHAWVLDLSDLSEQDAVMAALACQMGYDVDFVKLAVSVRGLLDAGRTAAEIAAIAPLSVERIALMPAMLSFDWSRFHKKPGETEHVEPAPVPAYCCPQCGHEWDGRPRPNDKRGWSAARLRRSRERKRWAAALPPAKEEEQICLS